MDTTFATNLTASMMPRSDHFSLSSSSSSSLLQHGVDNNAIRTKLFHRLGIMGPIKQPPHVVIGMKRSGFNSHCNAPLLEPIKCNCGKRQKGEEEEGDDEEKGIGLKKCHCVNESGHNNNDTSNSSSNSSSSTTTTTAMNTGAAAEAASTKGVRFTHNAQVWLIPRRQDYSSRLRKLLWYERHEHLNNIRRNTIEFWYEGWNWRTVMEEPNMYTHVASGERIHPVHVQDYYWKLQQQQQQQARQAPPSGRAMMPPSAERHSSRNGPRVPAIAVATPSTVVDGM